MDALDAFMANIKSGAMDTRTKMSLKRRLFDLNKEKTRLEKLANLARPATIVIAKFESTLANNITGQLS